MVIVDLIIPVKSILALRKAIMSMKDVGALITLRTFEQNMLEVSVVDHSICSAMYVHIPVRPFKGSAWVNITSSKLNELASKLKAYSNAVLLKMISTQSVFFEDAFTKQPIIGILKSCAKQTNNVSVVTTDEYYFIPFISVDLLGMFVNLSAGSAVVTARLQSNGHLSLWNNHEYGYTIIEKQLHGFPKVEEASDVYDLCKLRCVIKFMKQVVNPLVNSSTDQCMLCFPKHPDLPLVLQFLLSHDIHQYFLMLPFHTPLKHHYEKGSYQNPIQLESEHTALLSAMANKKDSISKIEPVLILQQQQQPQRSRRARPRKKKAHKKNSETQKQATKKMKKQSRVSLQK